MNTARNTNNRRWGGLIVAVLGVIGAIYLGIGARNAALDGAIRQATTELAPTLGARANGSPQAVVHRLVTTDASDMAFLTVRDRAHRLVASDGAWSHWFAGWASSATVRAWRAWMYRTLCADTYRSVLDGAQLHAGVPWWRVAIIAGPPFWATLLLSALGLVLFERERRAHRQAPPRLAAKGAASGRRSRPKSAQASAWRERLRRALPARRGEPPRPATGASPAPGFEPIGSRGRTPTQAPAPKPAPSRNDDKPAPESTPAAVDDPAQVVAPAAPAGAASAERTPSAPRASSAFGPYLLRFQPVWRGAMDGLLAGAAVRLVPADNADARPRTLDEVMVEGPDEPEACRTFVQWLMRRLVTLQANWRTLELPHVPVVLLLPETLLGFEGAEQIWAETLSRYEPAAGDLVFCVERMPGAGETMLPVRWAVAEQRTRDGQLWYRLMSGGHDESSADAVADGTRFVLPDDGAMDSVHQPLPPRAFGRLMSRSELAPL
ncbi:hypothetical protein [Salinisphaera sp. LB1]|uniref:hypothetical protein n=1 Tax=Salinisphaera sp. LB1 TaxID=2183911 RepID=UPI000D706BE1|nr:hypothetical protein [Salinisphaera sp. LB1]AWN16297.1 hypothetical protein SALB1_2099 [Salinisphaera sp. LB1]